MKTFVEYLNEPEFLYHSTSMNNYKKIMQDKTIKTNVYSGTGFSQASINYCKKYYSVWPIFLFDKENDSYINENNKLIEIPFETLDKDFMKLDLPSILSGSKKLNIPPAQISEDDRIWWENIEKYPKMEILTKKYIYLAQWDKYGFEMDIFDIINDWQLSLYLTKTIAYEKNIKI